jgi:diacylglycerol kinase family enzyme
MPNAPPPAPTRSTPLYIVINARSGAGDADEAHETMRSILTTAGQAHEFVFVERPEQLPEQARRAVEAARRHAGGVVVAGGDGTINAVAHAALAFELPFGIIPQGTFNLSGRAHGIPLDLEEATRALLEPRLKAVQAGVLNDRIFLVNASVGLYPDLFEAREEAKAQHGRSRSVALWATLRGLLQDHRPLSLEIEHDAEREIVRTPTLFVGNNPLQLERVGLPEADDVQRRQLAAVVVRDHSRRALLWLAVRGALGQLGEASNVRNFSFRRMTVNPWASVRESSRSAPAPRRLRQGRGGIKVAIDGEVLRMQPPLEFSIAPQPLWLMVPREAT